MAGAIKGVAGRSVHEDAPLMEEGLDSLSAVELGNALQDAVGIPMPATLVFDYPSATAIVAYIQNATDEAARDVDALDDTRQATWGQRCESVENNGIIRSDDEHLVFFRKLLVSNAAESLDSEVDAPFATALVHSALQAFFPSLKAFSSRNGEITNSDDHSPRAGKKRLLALHPLGSSGSGFCRQLAASRWIESLDDVCEFVFIDAMQCSLLRTIPLQMVHPSPNHIIGSICSRQSNVSLRSTNHPGCLNRVCHRFLQQLITLDCVVACLAFLKEPC